MFINYSFFNEIIILFIRDLREMFVCFCLVLLRFYGLMIFVFFNRFIVYFCFIRVVKCIRIYFNECELFFIFYDLDLLVCK